MNPIVLGPRWELRPVEHFNQGLYPLGNEGWIEQELPAHWQEHPDLRFHTGSTVYRHRFPASVLPRWRYWLRAAGIFYWSRIYLNGRMLDPHEGYFAPQEHEVTGILDQVNTLIVEVECPEEHQKTRKRMITGVFSHWDALDPSTNPGGIWLPVTIEQSGAVRLRHAQLSTESIDDSAATLRWQVNVDTLAALEILIRWSLVPLTFAGESYVVEERYIVRGARAQIGGSFVLPEPRVWWSHDLGRPDLYDVAVEVIALGELSDRRSFRFGVRTFELRDFQPYLNGERLLVKGNNYAPGDTRIARFTPEQARDDLELARQCHMNLLRVHAHVSHPALYEAADELGILIWQDFPLHWLYRRSIWPEARRQARQMVELLGSHASVVIWCMHNEPVFLSDTSDTRLSTGIRLYFSVFIWSWNRDVLDRQLARDVQEIDPRRPVITNSGEFAVPRWSHGSDTHFYFGWYFTYGRLRGFDSVRKYFPRNLRFVTEFGAQSFPNRLSCEKFMAPAFEQVDWDALSRYHSFQPEIMATWYDWRACETLDELIQLTQGYQSELNRFYIDRLRLSKYQPTGGIVPFLFADPNPAVQWSILDYWRVPKASYWAMRNAFRPQYAWTILDADVYPPGQELRLPIYLVNDAHAMSIYELTVSLLDSGGCILVQELASGILDADSLPETVRELSWIPESAGEYELRIELTSEGSTLINPYRISICSDASKG